MMQRLLLILLLLAGPALGKPTEHVRAELISGLKGYLPGKTLPLALHLKLDQHWHVYWKYAGAAGYPPKLTWTLPAGVKAGDLQFPFPERGEVSGLVGYVYNDEVTLPVNLQVDASVQGPLKLKAKAEWLACEKSCIPGEADLELELSPSQAPEPGPGAAAIQAAQDRMPVAEGLKASLSDQAELQFSSDLIAEPVEKAEFFPDQADLLDEAFQQTYKDGKLQLKFAEKKPSEVSGVLVVHTAKRDYPFALQLKVGQAAAAAAPPAPKPATGSLAGFLMGAFLGGMILNLMPCVFPVLSIKVLGLVESRGKEHDAYKHGLVFAAGVLVSFWVLAGLLLGLRAAGQSVGWGFQLQSPIFVAMMVCLFFGISLNLLGVFEVGEGLTRLGEYGQGKTGYADAFWSGALATAVATPCSAPFMGAAVGAAVTLPAWQALVIFTSLGLGMAFPYVFFTSFPVFLKRLPRPGAWMETFKQVMAFPMLLTMVIFLHVLGALAGLDGVTYTLAALVLLGLAAWIVGRWGYDVRSAAIRTRAKGGAAVVALVTLGLLVQNLPDKPPTPGQPVNDGIAWEAFSAERLAAARAAHKPVFIDFTAEWCLSCKANEKVALRNASVQARFRERGIVPLKADWTARDEAIARQLALYGRSSVPTYVYYPVDGEATVLPEAITPGIVLDALK